MISGGSTSFIFLRSIFFFFLNIYWWIFISPLASCTAGQVCNGLKVKGESLWKGNSLVQSNKTVQQFPADFKYAWVGTHWAQHNPSSLQQVPDFSNLIHSAASPERLRPPPAVQSWSVAGDLKMCCKLEGHYNLSLQQTENWLMCQWWPFRNTLWSSQCKRRKHPQQVLSLEILFSFSSVTYKMNSRWSARMKREKCR